MQLRHTDIYYKALWLSPYLTALLVTIIVVLLIPAQFTKYTVEVLEENQIGGSPQSRVSYTDLDGDGISEKIISFHNSQGNHAIQVFNLRGGIFDQWNFKGKIPGNGQRFVCADADADNYLEIYTFTEHDTAVYLHAFEPLDTISEINFKNRFIDHLCTDFSEPDYSIGNVKAYDPDQSGRDKVLFNICSGYSKFPKQVYIYDPLSDSLISTGELGTVISEPFIVDLNDDGRKDILGCASASGHIHDSLNMPYSDYSAWVMAFDDQLQFLFDPIGFPGFGCRLQIAELSIGDQPYFILMVNHAGAGEQEPLLLLYDRQGKLVHEKVFPVSADNNRSLIIKKHRKRSDEIYLLSNSGQLEKYNRELKLLKSIDFDKNFCSFQGAYDLDLDGKDEMIFMNAVSKDIMITRHDFSHPVIIHPGETKGGYGIDILEDGTSHPKLFIQAENSTYFLEYRKNPLYYFRLLIYLAIYLSILFFIMLIRKLQLFQLKKRDRLRSQILELQLKNINNQLDPHFTFNVFNTIGAIIRKEDKEKAYSSFLDFTKLIRSNLYASDRISRTLEEEIDHVTNYLQLEQLRFECPFKFKFTISEKVDLMTEVPKMIIQVFAENAVKHGLLNKKGNGDLQFLINNGGKMLTIIIEDNGIGRVEAESRPKSSTGLGLSLVDRYIKLCNHYSHSNQKLSYTITDLYDHEKQPAGTRVTVHIPINFSIRLGSAT